MAGVVVDHAYATKNGSDHAQTIHQWHSVCPGEPFEWQNVGPVPFYKPQASYDIAAAVKRQHKFAKKVRTCPTTTTFCNLFLGQT